MTYANWRGTAASLAAIGCALVLQACGGGGGGSPSARGDDNVGLNPAVPTSVTKVTPTGVPATVNSDAAAVVQVTGSTAQVTLPAAAFVAYDNASQAVSGEVDVVITPIAPSANPLAMVGGSYVARVPGSSTQTQAIESFGAITVDLTQGGQRVQLAPGKKATIRIPLDTRSNERPATMPLYYWDEQAKVWIQEGTATLKGDASSGQYYEGEVSHFSTWNADKPIEESVTVKGCLQDDNGKKLTGSTFDLYSEGVDYSGVAWASLSNGDFTVQMKKGGHANLALRDFTGQTPDQSWDLGTVNANLTLPACLVVKAQPTTPLTATEAFYSLLKTLGHAFDLSRSSAAALNIDMGLVLPADQVCASGALSQLQFNGNPVAAIVKLTPGTSYRLNTTFDACAPYETPGDTSSGSTNQVLTGNATADFSYTQSPTQGAINGTLSGSLQQLDDSATQLLGNGKFVITLSQAFGLNSATTTLSWAPQTSATMAHTAAGSTRTATFKGGNLTISTTNTGSGLPTVTMNYNALSYTLDGATYVLQGSQVGNAGQISLSKNGSVISTLTTTAAGASTTGMVDLF